MTFRISSIKGGPRTINLVNANQSQTNEANTTLPQIGKDELVELFKGLKFKITLDVTIDEVLKADALPQEVAISSVTLSKAPQTNGKQLESCAVPQNGISQRSNNSAPTERVVAPSDQSTAELINSEQPSSDTGAFIEKVCQLSPLKKPEAKLTAPHLAFRPPQIKPSPLENISKKMSIREPSGPVVPILEPVRPPAPESDLVLKSTNQRPEQKPEHKLEQKLEPKLEQEPELKPEQKVDLKKPNDVPAKVKRGKLAVDTILTTCILGQDLKDQNVFFIPYNNDVMGELADKIAEKIPQIENGPPVNYVVVGSILMGKSCDDDNWYRCQTTKVNGDNVSVHFFDYALDEDLPKSRLRQASFPSLDLKSIPAAAVRVRFRSIEEEQANKLLEGHLAKIYIEMYDESAQTYSGTMLP